MNQELDKAIASLDNKSLKPRFESCKITINKNLLKQSQLDANAPIFNKTFLRKVDLVVE